MKTKMFWQLILVITSLVCPFLNAFSQESISEKDDLKFQSSFFEALKQKEIGNYDKALLSLDNCQQIKPTNKAVLFELSKNNLFLKQYSEATFYIKEALKEDPNNVYLLNHLVNIYEKQQHYSKAIEVYKKVLVINPKQIAPLVKLYEYNGQTKEALKALEDFEKTQILAGYLLQKKEYYKARFSKKQTTKPIITSNETNLKKFKETKDYTLLKTLLNQCLTSQNHQKTVEVSDVGLLYFPAQAFLYLSKAQALNELSKYNEAIETLEIGIDFAIENKDLEQQFYKVFIVAYTATNQSKQANKYKKMLLP